MPSWDATASRWSIFPGRDWSSEERLLALSYQLFCAKARFCGLCSIGLVATPKISQLKSPLWVLSAGLCVDHDRWRILNSAPGSFSHQGEMHTCSRKSDLQFCFSRSAL